MSGHFTALAVAASPRRAPPPPVTPVSGYGTYLGRVVATLASGPEDSPVRFVSMLGLGAAC
jgi:hypothetical protein